MGLTKVSYAMINGAPVNVLDFGADPTGSADSSAAIQAAVTASSDVVIPAGTYKISSTISLPNRNTRISGSGKLTTVTTLTNGIFQQVNRGVFTNIEGLFFTGASIGFYRKANDVTAGTPYNEEFYEFNITNCSFIMNSGVFGISAFGSREAEINECYFETGSGVNLQTCINVEINNCVWKNCTTYGIYEWDNTQGTKVLGGTSLGCSTWLKSNDCNGTFLNGTMADFNDTCVVLQGSISVQIMNCYLSSRTKTEVIRIATSASARVPYLVKLIGNTIVNNYAALHPSYSGHDAQGVYINGCNFLMMQANNIVDYTQSGITIIGVTNGLILNNTITGYPAVKGTACIQEPSGDCVAITIHNNTVGQLVNPAIPFVSVTTKDLFNNYGYTSEANGEFLVSAGSTSATFAHGLTQQPGKGCLVLTPVLPLLPIGTSWWFSTITSTTATVNFTNVLTDNILFQWTASVRPF